MANIIKTILNSPGLKALRAVQNNPAVKMARKIHKSPAMKAARRMQGTTKCPLGSPDTDFSFESVTTDGLEEEKKAEDNESNNGCDPYQGQDPSMGF